MKMREAVGPLLTAGVLFFELVVARPLEAGPVRCTLHLDFPPSHLLSYEGREARRHGP